MNSSPPSRPTMSVPRKWPRRKFAQRAQNLVAHVVAVKVVDVLEIVDIQKHDGAGLLRRALQAQADGLLEAGAVEQPGQRVCARLLLQALGEHALLRDVRQFANDPAPPPPSVKQHAHVGAAQA